MFPRAPVLGSKWSVSCDQPLASKIGADILQAGGNAADAALAMFAGLSVLQPSTEGLGGDAFCLYYSAKDKSVRGVNASGPSPSHLTLDLVHSKGFNQEHPPPPISPLNVTVPGAPAGFVDIHHLLGSGNLSLRDLLTPAIFLAEEGFPVSPLAALFWRLDGDPKLMNSRHGSDLLLHGRIPSAGDIMRMPKMAASFRELASYGKDGFYSGRVAQAIADEIQHAGGCMTYEDLRQFGNTPAIIEQPIAVDYKGAFKVWHLPPNCFGLIVLLALNILEGFDLREMGHNTSTYLYTVLETLRLAFADGLDLVCDPRELRGFEIDQVLSKEYANLRRTLLKEKANPGFFDPGFRTIGSDTTYLSVVDGDGNACSFMATCCSGFGSGIVPEGCGFALTNRGMSFTLEEGRRNVLGPWKKPLHTNIPSMVTDSHSGELLSSMGAMGYFLQPQTQLQILLNMFEFGMNPQEALDAPRATLTPTAPPTLSHFNYGRDVSVEANMSPSVLDGLTSRGFNVKMEPVSALKLSFGRGHVITRGDWWNSQRQTNTGVLWTGCDSRSDGIAISW